MTAARTQRVSAFVPKAPPRRDSLRRRSLVAADLVALCASYGVVWLLAPPAATITSKLVLVAALPAWIVLNKLLGLHDRMRT